MAEVEDGVAVGRLDNPEPANETDRVVFSDEEKSDYERFGAVPEPEEPGAYGAPSEEKAPVEKSEDKLQPAKRGVGTPTPPPVKKD